MEALLRIHLQHHSIGLEVTGCLLASQGRSPMFPVQIEILQVPAEEVTIPCGHSEPESDRFH